MRRAMIAFAAAGLAPPAVAGELFTYSGPMPGAYAAATPSHRAALVTVNRAALPEPTAGPGAVVDLGVFDDTPLSGRVTGVTLTSGGAVYSGELVDEAGSSFILVTEKDAIVGEVRSPARGDYDIRPIATGELAVRQVDQSRFRACAMGPEHEVGVAVNNPEDAGGMSVRANTVVRVLVMYTAEAMVDQGGENAMNALVNLAISQANSVYTASGVTITLELAYAGLTDYTESGDAGTDLSRWRSTSDGIMDEVHQIRECVGADMCALMVNNFNACGIGYLMVNVNNSFNASAFTVTDKDCVSNYSFAHELGHNMGCHHDRDNAGANVSYPYAYGYRTTDSAYRTVMAYSPGTRIGYFSNPNLSFQGRVLGVPVGQPLQAFNAQVLNNTRATVAAWRGAQSPADYNQDGFSDGLDYDGFIADWLSLAAKADVNQDEFVDAIDYDLFIAAFIGGC